MSQREQQLESELALTRAIVRAGVSTSRAYAIESALYYLREQERAQRAVAAWRPYDE